MNEKTASINQDVKQLIEIGWSMRTQKIDKSIAVSQTALELSETRGYKDGIIFALRNLGEIRYLLHEYQPALALVDQALAMIGDVEHPAKFDLYLTAASAHIRLNNLIKSLELCRLAEELATSAVSPQQKAAVFKTTGNIYLLSGNYETSIGYYNQANEIYQEIGDILGEIIILNNKCHCHQLAGDYALSIKYGLAGISLFSEWHSQKGLPIRIHAYNLNNVGTAYLKSKDYEKSPRYFERALMLFQKESDIYGEIYSWRGLGEVSLFNQDFEQAISQLQHALTLAENLGEAVELSRCHKTLALAYKQGQLYEQALFHYEKHDVFDKQLRNDEMEKELQKLEITYQVERSKHEAEIFQLKTVALQNEIDERILAQKEAQKQTNYFRALLQNSPFAILAVNMAGIIEECNPAFERLFGLEKQDIINQPIVGIFDQNEINEEIRNNVSKLLAGKTIHSTTKRPHRDGTMIDVELYTASILLNGEQVGSLVHYHDIRENIQREETLKAAKQAAETAVQAKSEFLAKMSHEIRTPLNGVIGVTDLLLHSNLTTQQQELTQIIHNSGDALLRIINDILDFSKIEAGKLELEMHPFSLRQAVEETIDLLTPNAAKKMLEIGYIIHPPSPLIVMGDVTRFQQILVNLLNNGIKFTDKGHVFVIFNSKPIDNKLVEIQVEVQDSGMGISPEGITRLFRSFSQVDNSITRKYGGTGLGLAISKQLVNLMSGRMWVESEVGCGTSFYFTLQVKDASPENLERLYPSQFTGKRLLVVDDNHLVRSSIATQTAVWGIESVCVETQAAAFNQIQESHFDAVLLDDHMPEGAGSQFAITIREALMEKYLPLLTMSSFCPPETRSELFDGCITKPIKQAELQSALSRAFSIKMEAIAQNKQNDNHWENFEESHPMNILLVEDNVVNQQVILRMLARLGYQIHIANNGVEALEAVRDAAYDVVLMDIQMPEMDGVTAMHEIHRQYQTKKSRPYIIALTANALKGDREHFLGQGMDNYLSKPIRLKDLTDTLARAYQFISV